MATTHSTSVDFGDCPRTPTSSRHISIYSTPKTPTSCRKPRSQPSPSRSSITGSSITGSTWSLKKPLSMRSIRGSAKKLFRRDEKASPVSDRRKPVPIWGSLPSRTGPASTEGHENPKTGALDWLKTSQLRKKHECGGKMLLPHSKYSTDWARRCVFVSTEELKKLWRALCSPSDPQIVYMEF